MGLSSAQAKGRIKNIASKNDADPRVLMRIYMMERFLERMSMRRLRRRFLTKSLRQELSFIRIRTKTGTP